MSRLLTLFAALLLAGCTSQLEEELKNGRSYPCSAADECPTGWVCGLEQRCRDPQVGGDYLCTDDSYCASNAGWRCGFAGTCQDTDAGLPYACELDSHCERGWRCDVRSHLCVDAANEGLPAPRSLTTTVVSPAIGNAPVQHFAASAYWDYDTTEGKPPLLPGEDELYCNDEMSTFAWSDATQLSQARIICEQYECLDFACENYRYTAPRTSVLQQATLSRPVLGFANLGPRTIVLDDSGVWSFVQTASGGARTELGLDFGATRVALLEPYSAGFGVVVVYGATQYAFVNRDGTTAGPFTINNTGGVPLLLTGFAAEKRSNSSGNVAVYALTTGGLYAAAANPTGFVGGTASFVPVQLPGLPNQACTSAPDLPAVADFQLTDDYWERHIGFAAEWRAGMTSNPTLRIWPLSATVLPTYTACQDISGGKTEITFTACPAAETLDNWHIGVSEYERALTRCLRENGTRHAISYTTAGATVDGDNRSASELDRGEPYDQPLLYSQSTPQYPAWIDAWGRVWSGNPGVSFYVKAAPQTMPQQPTLLLGGGTAPLFAQVRRGDRDPFDEEFAFTERNYTQQPGLGLLASRLYYSFDDVDAHIEGCGPVWGEESYSLTAPVELSSDGGTLGPARIVIQRNEDLVYGEGGPLLELEHPERFPRRPCAPNANKRAQAVQARTSSGRPWIIVTAADTLWAEDAAGLTPTKTRLMPVRASPLNALDFDRIAAVRPKGDEYISLYALIAQRVFHIYALNPTRWLYDELVPPAGEPIDVWGSGENGRVGFRDGRVFTLPSLVPLAPQLPGGVLSFGSACGEGFALTSAALYRLEPNPDGTAVGIWKQVVLPRPFKGELAVSLAGARLHTTASAVYVVTTGGVVYEIEGGCR